MQVQGPVALQPLADDGERLLAGVHADRDRGHAAARVADGDGDLVQRAADGVPLGEPGQLQQGLEGDDERHRLVGGQAQRPTMPAVKVTRTRSPSKARSIRSPGP